MEAVIVASTWGTIAAADTPVSARATISTAMVGASVAISENAVKVRLHRARQALRTLLDPALLGVKA